MQLKDEELSMQVEQQILVNVASWLTANQQTHQWLAQQLELTPRRLEQYFAGRYKLSVSQIEQLTILTSSTVAQLAQPAVPMSSHWCVRGQATTYASQTALTELTLASQHLQSLRLIEGLRHAN